MLDYKHMHDPITDARIATPPTEVDPMVTVPASVLANLVARVDRLEATTRMLREQLGGMTIRSLIASESVDEKQAELPTQANPTHNGTPIRLYSQLATEVDRPFTEVDADARARGELLANIHAKAAPFITLFAQEVISRASDTNTSRAKLPPRPSFEQSPADYAKYIKKHGKTIEWEEKDGFKAHQFSLTYLPGGKAPELVRFGIDTQEKKQNEYGDATDTYMDTLEFVLDHSSLVSASLEHKLSLGSYRGPLRIISEDYEVAVKLGADLFLTKRDFTEKKPTTFVYTDSERAFVDTTHTQPGTIKPSLTTNDCLAQIDRMLARVPMQSA